MTKAKKTDSQSSDLRKTKPSYKSLILKALRDSPMSARKGTSPQYILKYIQSNYETPDPTVVRRYISKRMKELVESNDVMQVNRSYRLTPTGRLRLKPRATKKKSTTKKPKVAKVAKTTKRGKTAKAATSRRGATVKSRTTKKAKTPKRRIAAASAFHANASLTTPESGVIWQYYDNGFQNYDIPASEVVEREYQLYLEDPGQFDVRAVKSGAFNYMVDFRALTQQNVDHPSHTVRKIRRVPFEESNYYGRD